MVYKREKIYKSIELTKAKYIIKKLMILYKSEKLESASFESRVLSDLANEQIIDKLNFIKI